MSESASPYVAASTPSPEDLDRLVRFVVDTVQPLRVVLFGSAVRGETHADSDVDLLVVLPDGADRRQVAMGLYEQQSRSGIRFPFPVEFVVTTESAFERKKDVFGLVYHDAAREGRTLYAA